MENHLQCSICDKTFERRYNLDRHYLLVYEKDEESESDMSSIPDDDMNDCDTAQGDSDLSGNEEEEDEMDDEDSDNDSATTEEEEADSEVSDNESVTSEEEEYDAKDCTPFEDLFEKTFSSYNDDYAQLVETLSNEDGVSRKEARRRAMEKFAPFISKTFRENLVNFIMSWHEKEKHPLFDSIIDKADALLQKDGVDVDEAVKTAVKKRKYAIDKLINLRLFD